MKVKLNKPIKNVVELGGIFSYLHVVTEYSIILNSDIKEYKENTPISDKKKIGIPIFTFPNFSKFGNCGAQN